MHACIARAPPTIECFLLSSYCARTERPPTFWPEAFLVAFGEEPLSVSYDNRKAHHHFSRRSKLHLTGAVKTGHVAFPQKNDTFNCIEISNSMHALGGAAPYKASMTIR